MKKIFTLLCAVGLFTLAQAQPGNRDNRPTDQRDRDHRDDNRYERDDDNNVYSFDRDDRYSNSRFSNERKRDQLIAKINRKYDYKIQKLRNSFYMGRMEKQRQMRFLQEQRQREIRKVYAKFDDRNRYKDRKDDKNRRY